MARIELNCTMCNGPVRTLVSGRDAVDLTSLDMVPSSMVTAINGKRFTCRHCGAGLVIRSSKRHERMELLISKPGEPNFSTDP